MRVLVTGANGFIGQHLCPRLLEQGLDVFAASRSKINNAGSQIHTLYKTLDDKTDWASDLKGIDIPEELVPIAIDEFPAILVAAACAKGETRLTGAAELRVKESDRLQAMLDGFRATGIKAVGTDDGMIVEGGQFEGGTIDSYGDHRSAMSFAVAGMVSKEAISITDCDNVATSFPGFVELASQAGMNISYE